MSFLVDDLAVLVKGEENSSIVPPDIYMKV